MKLWLCTSEHLYCGTHYKQKELIVTEDWEHPESWNGGFAGNWRELYASDFPGLVGYSMPAPPPDINDVWNEIQGLRNRVLELESRAVNLGGLTKEDIRKAWFE